MLSELDLKPEPTLFDARVDEALVALAGDGLPNIAPEHSSKTGLSPSQARFFSRLLTVLGLTGLFLPNVFLLVIAALGAFAFAALVLGRLILAVVGFMLRVFRRKPKNERAPDEDLPVYSVLVPLFDEEAVIPNLAIALSRLDYPPDKLDIKLLLEAGDEETHAAILAEQWPVSTDLLVLPKGHPQTKPRALNFGLQRARGQFVTVYDAEDCPHPAQLRDVLKALERGGERLGCIQAPLRGRNSGRGWLAEQWSLEYDVQFGLLLPVLSALKLAFPLGGTSNHFRREALLEVGGWDAWNVTEDADLGLRLVRFGWRVGMVRTPTFEEAPDRLSDWIVQRSRWLKGFMQTWLVFMRAPGPVIQQVGLLSFVIVQLLIGGAILAAFAHGPLLVWILVCLVFESAMIGNAGYALLSVGYGVNFLAALLAMSRPSGWRVFAMMTLPLYWPLQSLAACRAAYGQLKSPHFWAKTPHRQVSSKAAVSPDFAE